MKSNYVPKAPPTEMEALAKRYAPLNPKAVRITRLCLSGASFEEVQLPSGDGSLQWYPVIELEAMLYEQQKRAKWDSLKGRALTRLEPQVVLNTMDDYLALSPDKQSILAMSQKAFAAHLEAKTSGGITATGNPKGSSGTSKGSASSVSFVKDQGKA